ncbi:ribose import ATP-binding protein RbsA [Clostridium homopropionicum DSM 5847]|uniref:Ribose/galactose/methyl galactoside import ATP-binding protein n=1 Tax=Clostridium homopropionicum DSM 5847 TaxID=1121318 RepID=A0A0L6Z6L7_9CLOT|nr:sugar ABC transporter ATP-binding protein [Clostridium homopropionicum]KOA18601.1 ribose import ATP-binding protein RbsA [Clostridium homopropionicum DSM 5847]SFG49654.1 monosaccharide ABC transporter ATP-binding protein, CUT2 family [Clostridium homopropionicum]
MDFREKTVLEMKNISIEFPGVKALDDVCFTTETGKSHALIGANGAGKSTLMKVLSGAYNHYTGDIYFNGQKANIRSPKESKQYGVQIVYQEVDTALIHYLTVAENIMLNDMVESEDKRTFINWGSMYKKAQEILDGMKVKISSRKLVSELTLAEKQMVLIARAISKECKFLILDEPTAPLSNAETEELFRIVKELEDKNVGVIFISHRLPELFQVCHEITVMRNGQYVIKKDIKETNQNEVVEYMLGRKMDEQFPPRDSKIGDKLFEVKNLSDGNLVSEVNFHVNAGEIVGITGLVGAGKTELCKAIFGVTQNVTGERILKDKILNVKDPYDAVRQAIALVPEERRKEGILVSESVAINITVSNLKRFCKAGSFLDFMGEKNQAKKMIESLGIKTPSHETKVQNLSGGNQQKVAIGKWLVTDSEVYIFDEPTKGVDVGAKKDIFQLINNLAEAGKAVIYASCELSEILGVTDRVYVMYDGKISKELETSKTSEEEILYYSTGGK